MPKTIIQLHKSDGTPAAPGKSSPGWFIDEHRALKVPGYEKLETKRTLDWAKPFAEVTTGNKVEFFVSGDEYFRHVAKKISVAKKTIFITGWQVNYDVLLPVGKELKPLLTLLDAALRRGVDVYLMPWLSPQSGVTTNDFQTLLAAAHLNGTSDAFPNGPPGRCYCLPAQQQSDMGNLSVLFSHHQKLVVVDNEFAYVGGIDLAYGRRDDGNFSLTPEGRTLNELYSPCVPPIKKFRRVDLAECVTTAELLSALLFDGILEKGATFAASPAEGRVASGLDKWDDISESVSDGVAMVKDAWDNFTLLDDLLEPIRDAKARLAQKASNKVAAWTWSQLSPEVQAKIEKLRDTGSANAKDVVAAVTAWLNDAPLDRLPPEFQQGVADVVGTLARVLAVSFNTADRPIERYEELFKRARHVPSGAHGADSAVQPRMPWHDVHACIKGPAVYDLAMNFIKRWDSTAGEYNRSHASLVSKANKQLKKLFDESRFKLKASDKVPLMPAKHHPARAEPDGSNRIQVLRSAPLKMLRQEHAAHGGRGELPARAQNNCLKAMLRAIDSAGKFIYIEGQFFQTAYGADGDARGAMSGPVGALTDIRRSPGYKKFAQMLGIYGLEAEQIPGKIRWDKIDDVKRDPDGEAFWNDLDRVLANLATVKALQLAEVSQESLYNPIGKAIANRISQAIADGKPFHVYIVLPVHPEGTLDTINIMSQVHLTMQSLVHGKHSLVNEVRRAILRHRMMKEKGISESETSAQIARMDQTELEGEVTDAQWGEYLTLLNLRNWEEINGRPVTEQIYVHSKLLIADDRVAILGSANINDRSQWGDRDSELAVIVHDATPTQAPLDGKNAVPVSASVHDLRKRLWKKLFGGNSKNRQAAALLKDSVLSQPVNPATWRAIQGTAAKNASLYDGAFWYVPRSEAPLQIQPWVEPPPDKTVVGDSNKNPPGSLWPVWRYSDYYNHELGGALAYRMPFDPLFWRDAERADVGHTWQPRPTELGRAPEKPIRGVAGFVCALPTRWTEFENNNTGFSLTAIALNGGNPHNYASRGRDSEKQEETAT